MLCVVCQFFVSIKLDVNAQKMHVRTSSQVFLTEYIAAHCNTEVRLFTLLFTMGSLYPVEVLSLHVICSQNSSDVV